MTEPIADVCMPAPAAQPVQMEFVFPYRTCPMCGKPSVNPTGPAPADAFVGLYFGG